MWCMTVRRLSSCSRAVTIWNYVACGNRPEIVQKSQIFSPCCLAQPCFPSIMSIYESHTWSHTHPSGQLLCRGCPLPQILSYSFHSWLSHFGKHLFLPMPSCMNQNRPVSHLRFPKRKVEGESIIALQISMIVQVLSSGNTNSSLFKGLLVYTWHP
jgi:hypothetical protein